MNVDYFGGGSFYLHQSLMSYTKDKLVGLVELNWNWDLTWNTDDNLVGAQYGGRLDLQFQFQAHLLLSEQYAQRWNHFHKFFDDFANQKSKCKQSIQSSNTN